MSTSWGENKDSPGLMFKSQFKIEENVYIYSLISSCEMVIIFPIL